MIDLSYGGREIRTQKVKGPSLTGAGLIQAASGVSSFYHFTPDQSRREVRCWLAAPWTLWVAYL